MSSFVPYAAAQVAARGITLSHIEIPVEEPSTASQRDLVSLQTA